MDLLQVGTGRLPEINLILHKWECYNTVLLYLYFIQNGAR